MITNLHNLTENVYALAAVMFSNLFFKTKKSDCSSTGRMSCLGCKHLPHELSFHFFHGSLNHKDTKGILLEALTLSYTQIK